MTMVMLLVDGEDNDVAITARMADELARLGVTSIAICRDGRTLGIVLEGWAFDAGSADEAARALVDAPHNGRVLLPAVQLAVSGAHAQERETIHGAEALP
jgi:hypothetical protein